MDMYVKDAPVPPATGICFTLRDKGRSGSRRAAVALQMGCGASAPQPKVDALIKEAALAAEYLAGDAAEPDAAASGGAQGSRGPRGDGN